MAITSHKQKIARYHNYQHWNVNKIQFDLARVYDTPTLTDDSKEVILRILDDLRILRTTMKIRRY